MEEPLSPDLQSSYSASQRHASSPDVPKSEAGHQVGQLVASIEALTRIQPDSAPPSALRNRDRVRLAAIKVSGTAQTYVLPAPASISNSEFCSANLLTTEQVADGVCRLQLNIEVGLAAELRHGWEGLDAGAL